MDWEECYKKRIVKEVNEDINLIESLLKTSKNKFDSQSLLELNEKSASSKISLSYDSLREVLESLALKKRYKVYNHECYTPFLKEIMNMAGLGSEFDELRKIRNSINYYGKEISINEALNVLNRIALLREKVLGLINNNSM
ncbi:MAG: hypothetical protein Q7S27_00595 [Nanoarchaeota archaeon]|nr:hypothetical protein [Nanoarchaeota archaeon]